MKYIITFDYGCGDEYEVVDCESFEQAEREAYESWKEGAESQASYHAEPYTEELAEDYGL